MSGVKCIVCLWMVGVYLGTLGAGAEAFQHVVGMGEAPQVGTPAKAAPTVEASPIDLNDEAAIRVGKGLFVNTCSFCHEDGGRKAGRGPKLSNDPNDNAFLYHRIVTGSSRGMPSFARVFTPKQIWSLIAYIRSLKDDEN
jgi:mono/diheme cytochrome c family protein